MLNLLTLAASTLSLASPTFGGALDQSQWGERWSRNMVSEEKGLPDTFHPKIAKNIAWVAKLGSETHSTPVIAGWIQRPVPIRAALALVA